MLWEPVSTCAPLPFTSMLLCSCIAYVRRRRSAGVASVAYLWATAKLSTISKPHEGTDWTHTPLAGSNDPVRPGSDPGRAAPAHAVEDAAGGLEFR